MPGHQTGPGWLETVRGGHTAPTAGSLEQTRHLHKASRCTVLPPPPSASTLGRGAKPIPKLAGSSRAGGPLQAQKTILASSPSVKPGGTSPPKPAARWVQSIAPHCCGSPHGVGIAITSSPSPTAPPGGGVRNQRQLEGSPHPQAYQNSGLAAEVLAFAALPARAAGAGGVPEQEPQHHGQAAPHRARHPGRGYEAGLARGMRGAADPETVQDLWGEKRKKTHRPSFFFPSGDSLMLSLMRPPYPFLLFPFSKSPQLGLQERGPLLRHPPAPPSPVPSRGAAALPVPRELR